MQNALLFLTLHRLVSLFEDDPESFVIGNLPLSLQLLVRGHAKGLLDAAMDGAVGLLPILQPRALSRVPHDTDGTLDVFRPVRTAACPAPVLLFVHGGIWTLGSKEQYRALGQRLALEGFVAVIAGYTTWPEANASAQVTA